MYDIREVSTVFNVQNADWLWIDCLLHLILGFKNYKADLGNCQVHHFRSKGFVSNTPVLHFITNTIPLFQFRHVEISGENSVFVWCNNNSLQIAPLPNWIDTCWTGTVHEQPGC